DGASARATPARERPRGLEPPPPGLEGEQHGRRGHLPAGRLCARRIPAAGRSLERGRRWGSGGGHDASSRSYRQPVSSKNSSGVCSRTPGMSSTSPSAPTEDPVFKKPPFTSPLSCWCFSSPRLGLVGTVEESG